MFNLSANYELRKESLGNTSFCQLDQKKYLWCVYPCREQKIYNFWGLDALCRFRHPHLQQAYHIFLTSNSCNLLFPIYTRTVNKIIDTSVPFAEKISYFQQLLSALAFLHRQNLTHNNITLQSIFFLNETIILCNLSKVEYLSPQEKFRKDLYDLANLFWFIMVEDEKISFPSYSYDEIQERITDKNYYEMHFINLTKHMMDPDDPFTATDYLRFPIFGECSSLPFTEKELLNCSIVDPYPNVPYPQEWRTIVKVFLNKSLELFPELDIRHLFKAIIAGYRLRGVGLPLEDILWMMLYFSFSPDNVENYCTKVGLDFSKLKHWQIKIVDYLNGHIWTDQITALCLDKDQYATIYFDVILHKNDPTLLLNLDPDNLPAFLGPCVVKTLNCRQGDICDTK